MSPLTPIVLNQVGDQFFYHGQRGDQEKFAIARRKLKAPPSSFRRLWYRNQAKDLEHFWIDYYTSRVATLKKSALLTLIQLWKNYT